MSRSGPLPLDMTGQSVAELVSLGCKFVVDGPVFSALVTLIDRLIEENASDDTGIRALLELRAILLQTSVPVRSKIGDENKLVVPDKKLVIPT